MLERAYIREELLLTMTNRDLEGSGLNNYSRFYFLT